MKKNRLFIAIVEIIALMLCFVSCKKEPPVENPPRQTGGPEITLDSSSIAKYTVVRRDEATAEEKAAASALAANLEVTFSVKPNVISDFEAAGEYEILVGETNREESAAVYEGLKYKDYRISVKGSKIVIAAGCEDSLDQAVEYFSSLLTGDKVELSSYEYNATYAIDGLTISGVKASNYNIVYSGETQLEYANMIQKAIGERTGERLSVVDQRTDKTEYEIVVGKTSRKEYDSISYYCYDIFNDGKCIYINAYDKYALYAAAEMFSDTVGDMGPSATIDEFDYTYVVPTHEELIEDIDKLYMRWASEWTPDPRMLDWDLKVEAFTRATDILLTCAHRAESIYYPENSIPAIISWYNMGGTAVELDVRLTKDEVLVLMHDGTLDRMTDWDVKKGKNGLPTSNKVSDWTYEQLQQLNLKESNGGANAVITPFKIPTFVDALKVCKDRLFIAPDNKASVRYSNVDNLIENKNLFFFGAMKEADNYNSILLSYGLTKLAAVDVQKQIYEYSGEVAYIMVRDDSAQASTLRYLENNAIENSYAISVGGTYFTGRPATLTEVFREWREKIMLHAWTIDDIATNDNATVWQEMYDLGYRSIMTNNYLEMVKFAAATCKFD